MRRARHLLVFAVLAVTAAFAAVACSGTAVFDHPDPTACATGHGCPMAACACADGSVVLDTTCRSGDCDSVEEVCADRCAPLGGAIGAVGSPRDVVPVPGCDTFCTRLLVNGCRLGCDTLFSECRAPSECSPTAGSFWRCVVNDAVIVCDDNAVHVRGCDASALSICEG